MRKLLVLLLLTGAVLSCGTARRSATPSSGRQASAPEAVSGQTDSLRQELTAPVGENSGKISPQPAPEPSEPDQLIAYARSYLGTPYKLGATGPKEFDCSGFTSYVFRHFGYSLTAYSAAQFREGREVASYADLQKGDLVFFGKRGNVRSIGHVGIVVSIEREKGSFTFIHASASRGVTLDSSSQAYFMMRYIGARRILPDE